MYFPNTKKDGKEINPFLIYSYNIITNKQEIYPRFRSIADCKTPISSHQMKWFFDHNDLVNVTDWIEINIFSNMPTLTDSTIGVLTRIATGMLNKCNLPKDLIMQLHENLVNNINSAYRNKLFSELPF